jgi:hypothetical protein
MLVENFMRGYPGLGVSAMQGEKWGDSSRGGEEWLHRQGAKRTKGRGVGSKR